MLNSIMYIISILLFISIGSFSIMLLFGKQIGYKGVYLIVLLNTVLLMILSILLLYINIENTIISIIKTIKWFRIELVNINFGIIIDPLSVMMLFVVTIISFCANIYSIEYMKNDPHIIRYFSYLALFTFFMLFLVTSENLIQLFIGWEGVGICSYILINFWYCRLQAGKSAILAVLANKIGDISLLVASILVYCMFKTNSFFILNNIFIYINIINYNEIINLEFLSILLIVACIGKSAQFGFHFWLPEAMEGPTPVSSLIHAATMVTAGIFLILRTSNLFILTTYSSTFILIVGSITLFFAATVGITQVDIKKIVAYSTCSQLGYMFLSCGFYGFSNAFFHLFIHAFFKALLFLTAGYIIHLLSNEQDIRKMGGLLKVAPFSYNLMLIGSYALSGLPAISGSYSKETLMEYALNTIFVVDNSYVLVFSIFSITLAFITIKITLIYSVKSILDIYFFNFNGFKKYIKAIHFSSYQIKVPLILLSFSSIYFGYIFNELVIGLNSFYIGTSLNTISNYVISEFYIYYRTYIIYILYYFIFIFIFLSIYNKKNFYVLIKCNKFLYNIFYYISKKYLFLNRLILYKYINNLFKFSYTFMYKFLDKGFIEVVGPYGITYKLYRCSILISSLQTGYIYHYLGYFFIVLILLIFFSIYFLI